MAPGLQNPIAPNYDAQTAPPALSSVYDALAPDPGAEYGSILPFARDTATGEKRFAMPSIFREGLLGLVDLAAGTETGQLTPRGLETLGGTGMGAGTTAPKGAIGMFAGSGAKTADMQALHKAVDMTADGLDRAQIWKDTGWMKGPEGKWKFEVNDLPAEYSPGRAEQAVRAQGVSPVSIEKQGFQTNLPNVLDHPDLYAAYPNLKDTVWQSLPPANIPAGFAGQQNGHVLSLASPVARRLEAGKSVTLHEVQHQIQDFENFARGGMPAASAPDDLSKAQAFSEYMHLAGEAEARNVEARRYLTEGQRRDTPPWETLDRPENRLVVRGVR